MAHPFVLDFFDTLLGNIELLIVTLFNNYKGTSN